jgi:regulator of protease activity HflC (stomatin/prohibitin superfamily)
VEQVGLPFGLAIALIALAMYLVACIRIIKEYERGVLFFLGRYDGLKGPGLRFVWVPIYRMRIVDLRLVAEEVPPQDVITKDNVSTTVSAVIYFRVVDPDKAVLRVEDYRYATSQLSQTTLRSIVGAHSLDELLSERKKLNEQIQLIIDEGTEPWGIKVVSVEIKHVDLPGDMRRIMARQAEAERERRAKVIAAEGEYQAAQKLADAARIIGQEPGTLQLRYLQTLVEITASQGTTTVIPLPIDILNTLDRKQLTRTFSMGSDGSRTHRVRGTS